MDEDAVLRSLRRKPIADISSLALSLDYEKSLIEAIIPHRDPFLLIDRLTGLDRDERIISGSAHIPEDLPLFKGHFPEHPVYPGCMQIEMIGQLGLCLYHFISRDTDKIEGPYPPMALLATRVGGAYYLKQIKPGDTVQVIAKALQYDDWSGRVMGQILLNGEVACVASGDVTFLD